MVSCEILGPGPDNLGLGNQLFCVAATLGYAFKHNLDFCFPQLQEELYKPYAKTIFHNLTAYTGSSHNPSNLFQEAANSSTVYTEIPPLKNVKLEGFFQSYKYFAQAWERIRPLLTLPPKKINDIRQEHQHLLPNSGPLVAVHVRRGDYVSRYARKFQDLSDSYYPKAFEHFTNSKFIIFSDDIKWCKKYFKNCGHSLVFAETNCEITDLYLMSQATHNIIANSTFSWWGAYLNPNPDKTIIAPKKWFGEVRSSRNNQLNDLFPPSWILI